MYEIVANERNSIDVDKFDYIVRDTANLGLKSTFDFSRSAPAVAVHGRAKLARGADQPLRPG